MATPALRIRIAPKFPTKIQGSGGITIDRTGGVVTINGSGVSPAATVEEMREGIDNGKKVTPTRSAQAVSEQVYSTRAELLTYNLPAAQTRVRTSGRDAPGIGGAEFIEITGTPSVAGFTTLDGRKWDLAHQDINVEIFGARPYTYAELIAANGDVVDSAAAFEAAHDFVALTGGTLYALGQFYVLSKGLAVPAGVIIEGAGHGMWNPNFRTEHKTWEGTNLLFKGAGAKSWSTVGVTSMRYSGGWRTDPDSARVFKLTSLMNEDASGSTPATPRPLAVAIRNRDPEEPFGLRKMRICPWIGTDGISEYETTSGSDLGDEWDIGVLLADAEQAQLSEVQIRGYWRAFGLLELSAGYSSEGRSEGNILRKVSAQGHTGLGVRSGDIWQVKATTSSTLEILWSEESYWPASGAFEGLQNGTDYTYTSLSRNGANLVFNGVSPDPSGTTQIRNPLRGTGFSTGILENCEGWALWHHSGQSAETLGFSSPSKGAEFSGYPLRGLSGLNPSIFGENTTSPCVFFHDCDDLVLMGGKLEIGYVIASPFEGSSAASAPSGHTANLRLADTYVSTSCDLRLFTPRSFSAPQLQINPVARLSGEFLLEAYAGQAWQARKADGEAFEVLDESGNVDFRVTAAGSTEVKGTLTVGDGGAAFISSSAASQSMLLRTGTTTRITVTGNTGNTTPGADNTQNLGSGSLRWAVVFAGTGSINTSDAREKQDVEPIPDEWLDAWGDVQWVRFRWKEAATTKGDGARWHTGLIAQQVRDAFAARGIDAFAIGLLCHDSWEDQPEVREAETGDLLIPAIAAGDRYGVRYSEAEAIEAAFQRRRIDRLEALTGKST